MTNIKLPPKIGMPSAIERAKKLIKDRKEGKNPPFTLPLKKVDEIFGKIEPNTIMTIGGQSGYGKSTIGMFLLEEIRKGNLHYQYEVLVLNFEMLSETVILRELSKRTGLSTRQLKSTYDPLSDEDWAAVESVLEEMEEDPISFINKSSTGKVIANAIYHHWKDKCQEDDKVLLYLVDHALLVESDKGQPQDKDKLFNLMNYLNQIKLKIANEGGKTFGIVLSQLNRMQQADVERKDNPNHHYPTTASLFGSSAMEQFSDYIIIPHVPYKLNIDAYGPLSLPTSYTEKGEVKPFIFLHLLKNRHDSLTESVVMCKNNFNKASIEELENVEEIVADFNDGKEIIMEDYG